MFTYRSSRILKPKLPFFILMKIKIHMINFLNESEWKITPWRPSSCTLSNTGLVFSGFGGICFAVWLLFIAILLQICDSVNTFCSNTNPPYNPSCLEVVVTGRESRTIAALAWNPPRRRHRPNFTKKFILRPSRLHIKMNHNLISYSNDSISRVRIYHPVQEWGYKQCHPLSAPDAAVVD